MRSPGWPQYIYTKAPAHGHLLEEVVFADHPEFAHGGSNSQSSFELNRPIREFATRRAIELRLDGLIAVVLWRFASWLCGNWSRVL